MSGPQTAGYDQSIYPTVPTVNPNDTIASIGNLINSGNQGFLSGIQMQQAPSQAKAAIAGNLLQAKQNQYLSQLSPAQSLDIQKNGLPKTTVDLGGHMDEDGNWVVSQQDSVLDPLSGKSFATGSVKQVSKPTSQIVTTTIGGPNGEPVATTTNYVLKPGAPKDATAIAYDPASGEMKPTEWAQAIPNATSALVAHFQPPPRNNVGAAAAVWKQYQDAIASGNTQAAKGYQALYNATVNGDEAAKDKIEEQIDSMKKKDDLAAVGKDPISLNDYTQRNLQNQIDQLKQNGATPEAIQEAESYLKAAQTRGSQLRAAAQADIQVKNSVAAKNASGEDQSKAKNATELAKANISSLTGQLNMANAAIASPQINDATRADFIKQRTALQAQLKQATDAAGGNANSSALSNQQIPAGAINDLKNAPDTAAQFDQIFGPGAAERILKPSQ